MNGAIGMWKPVKGFQNLYEISSDGFVRGKARVVKTCKNVSRKVKSKILKSRLNNCGYEEVRLSKNGKTKTKFIHRLIAENFIDNPDNKKEVNHKNGIKTDNSIENLEWATHQENMKHASITGLLKKSCKKAVTNLKSYTTTTVPTFTKNLTAILKYIKTSKYTRKLKFKV